MMCGIPYSVRVIVTPYLCFVAVGLLVALGAASAGMASATAQVDATARDRRRRIPNRVLDASPRLLPRVGRQVLTLTLTTGAVELKPYLVAPPALAQLVRR